MKTSYTVTLEIDCSGEAGKWNEAELEEYITNKLQEVSNYDVCVSDADTAHMSDSEPETDEEAIRLALGYLWDDVDVDGSVIVVYDEDKVMSVVSCLEGSDYITSYTQEEPVDDDDGEAARFNCITEGV